MAICLSAALRPDQTAAAHTNLITAQTKLQGLVLQTLTYLTGSASFSMANTAHACTYKAHEKLPAASYMFKLSVTLTASLSKCHIFIIEKYRIFNLHHNPHSDRRLCLLDHGVHDFWRISKSCPRVSRLNTIINCVKFTVSQIHGY